MNIGNHWVSGKAASPAPAAAAMLPPHGDSGVVYHGSLLTAAGFVQPLEAFLQLSRRNFRQEILIGDSFDYAFVKKDFLAASSDVFKEFVD